MKQEKCTNINLRLLQKPDHFTCRAVWKRLVVALLFLSERAGIGSLITLEAMQVVVSSLFPLTPDNKLESDAERYNRTGEIILLKTPFKNLPAQTDFCLILDHILFFISC